MAVMGEAVNVKPMVSGLRDFVEEDIAVINLLLYNKSRKIGSYNMAKNLMCLLSRDAMPGP